MKVKCKYATNCQKDGRLFCKLKNSVKFKTCRLGCKFFEESRFRRAFRRK